MRDNWAKATARRLGLGGEVDLTPARVGVTLHLPCARGHIVDFKVDRGLNPEGVAKRMLAKGWTMGHRLICPKHSRKKKGEARPAADEIAEGITEHEEEKVEMAKEPAAAAAASDAAKEAKRLTFLALGDAYDTTAKRYKKDWNDKRVSDESGLAEAAVITLREEFFGPLGEPSELAEIRDAIAELNSQEAASRAHFDQQMKTLTGRFERLCTKHGWTE